MMSRKEEESLKKNILDLEGKNKQLEMLVDKSSVEAVRKAEKRATKAEHIKDAAIEEAEKEVKKFRAEAKAEIKVANESKKKSREREYISYGLVASILLIASTNHPNFWVDLVHAILDPLSLAGTTWMGYLHPVSEITPFERWFCLIVIPIIVIGSFALLFLLGVWYKRRWNLLTVVSLVFDLAVTIICGDWLPVNRFIGSVGLMIAYVVFCKWADRKWVEYPECDRWEHLQKDLVWN